MANEEHLAILRQGVEIWNEWRKKNLEIQLNLIKADLSRANLSEVNLSGAKLTWADLSYTNLSKADLSRADLSYANLSKADLSRANFSRAFLVEANFSSANLSKADLSEANLSKAFLVEANLNEADLSSANLSCADLSRAKLSRTELYIIRALGTNFTAANFTGACLENWHTNSDTNLTNVICDYVYLQRGQQERRPSSGNFAPGEFTKLFQKSLETLDLIFRNGIDWDAFAYSFKKVEVENQGAQLDVQSIEKKGDGILVVRVAVSPDADKAKIHSEFMQGYEFATKVLEAQYQARLEEKNMLIAKQEAQINRLFDIVEQQGTVQKALAENPRKVSNYDQRYSQLGGGIVDANTVNAEQIDSKIQNTDS
ncbi:pentapeptide repeat-containing protein [Fischerella thermalis]|uniref:Low-complexity protein n=1 Tax=Fischerella thermalis CCMEE 5318 TaxID=2019666 RepID=A0A2N6L4D8_9CYAN|nr:pentapeptide repeat-containing protein [Fischerella thermalis]PMB15556.1 low-complexity protein [Fischerella thermalis CCMEE 5318]